MEPDALGLTSQRIYNVSAFNTTAFQYPVTGNYTVAFDFTNLFSASENRDTTVGIVPVYCTRLSFGSLKVRRRGRNGRPVRDLSCVRQRPVGPER